MSARIFVHPACVAVGPRQDAMQDALARAGYPFEGDAALRIGPPSKKGYRELVTRVEVLPMGTEVLERMDGTRFEYKPLPAMPGVA